MSKSGFEWVVPPSDLSKALQDYGHKVKVAVYAIANKWGQDVQDIGRNNAAWIDRTGNARSGIFYAADGFGFGTVTGTVSINTVTAQMSDTTVESGSDDVLIVTLGHTVFYGKFLELSNGGRYAIILSTIEENLPRLNAMMQGLFEG